MMCPFYKARSMCEAHKPDMYVPPALTVICYCETGENHRGCEKFKITSRSTDDAKPDPSDRKEWN
jgi:hypothetical protein